MSNTSSNNAISRSEIDKDKTKKTKQSAPSLKKTEELIDKLLLNNINEKKNRNTKNSESSVANQEKPLENDEDGVIYEEEPNRQREDILNRTSKVDDNAENENEEQIITQTQMSQEIYSQLPEEPNNELTEASQAQANTNEDTLTENTDQGSTQNTISDKQTPEKNSKKKRSPPKAPKKSTSKKTEPIASGNGRRINQPNFDAVDNLIDSEKDGAAMTSKSKKQSYSGRSGLILPVSSSRNFLKENIANAKITKEAPIAITASLEYGVLRLLQDAMLSAVVNNRKSIDQELISHSIRSRSRWNNDNFSVSYENSNWISDKVTEKMKNVDKYSYDRLSRVGLEARKHFLENSVSNTSTGLDSETNIFTILDKLQEDDTIMDGVEESEGEETSVVEDSSTDSDNDEEEEEESGVSSEQSQEDDRDEEDDDDREETSKTKESKKKQKKISKSPSKKTKQQKPKTTKRMPVRKSTSGQVRLPPKAQKSKSLTVKSRKNGDQKTKQSQTKKINKRPRSSRSEEEELPPTKKARLSNSKKSSSKKRL